MKMFKPVLIVPFYNHADAFTQFSQKLARLKMPVILINDGSEESQTEQVKKICEECKFFYIEHPQNQGKGAAVKTGIQEAFNKGYTHALQIDSDGQHDINDVPKFLELAKKYPDKIINGAPLYDESAPKSRVIGRKITNFWVCIETGSRKIKDSMCGFRVYPIKKIYSILPQLKFNRMGFDPEILVKAYRLKTEIYNEPTKVVYPKGGVSHFHAFKDNFSLTCLHTYLCCWSLMHLFWKGKKDGI